MRQSAQKPTFHPPDIPLISLALRSPALRSVVTRYWPDAGLPTPAFGFGATFSFWMPQGSGSVGRKDCSPDITGRYVVGGTGCNGSLGSR
jgi:hypothetical protein